MNHNNSMHLAHAQTMPFVFQLNILRFEMIDRVLNFGPVQQDSYYFQLIPISLAIVTASDLPAKDTTYKFTVSKGQQKFDENKIPIEASFQVVGGRPVLPINSCRLNFYLPNYNKSRKQDFSLFAVQRQHSQDFQLGEHKISVDGLISQFKENNKVRHQFRAHFSDDYELEFEVYVERNRMALQRTIRDNKAERINKSPLRARKQERTESPKKSFSPRQEQTEIAPSRDREEPREETTPVQETSPRLVQDLQKNVAVQESEPVEETPVEKAPEEAISSPHSQKAPPSIRNAKPIEKSEKDEAQSRKTGQAVPIMTTKFKPVASADTPAVVDMEKSLRLLSTSEPTPQPKQEGESLQEKLGIWAFLIVSFFLMYLSMHPNRRA